MRTKDDSDLGWIPAHKSRKMKLYLESQRGWLQVKTLPFSAPHEDLFLIRRINNIMRVSVSRSVTNSELVAAESHFDL